MKVIIIYSLHNLFFNIIIIYKIVYKLLSLIIRVKSLIILALLRRGSRRRCNDKAILSFYSLLHRFECLSSKEEHPRRTRRVTKSFRFQYSYNSQSIKKKKKKKKKNKK